MTLTSLMRGAGRARVARVPCSSAARKRAATARLPDAAREARKLRSWMGMLNLLGRFQTGHCIATGRWFRRVSQVSKARPGAPGRCGQSGLVDPTLATEKSRKNGQGDFLAGGADGSYVASMLSGGNL